MRDNIATATPRSAVAGTAISYTATLAAIVILSGVLAYWTWTWLGPHPEPRLPPAPGAATGAAAAALFGTVQAGPTMAPAGSVSITLIGVAAGSRHAPGYAVVQIGGRDIVAAREGADLAAGIRLAEVHVDRVVLDRGGTRETIAWPQSGTMAGPAAAVQNVGIAAVPVRPDAPAGASGPPNNAVIGPAPTKADRDRLSD
jgi:general secretion pathway protein C